MTLRIEHRITGPEDVRTLESQASWDKRSKARSSYDLIAAAAADHPSANAITFVANGDPDEPALSITFEQLLGRVTQTANLFTSLGVGPGDVVSVLLPNLPQTHFSMWGGATAGIVNPINFLLQPEQIADLLNTARTKVLVALGPHPALDIWQKVEAVRHQVPSLVKVLYVGSAPEAADADVASFDEMVASQNAHQLDSDRQISRDDPAIYFHTGGTTGSPKMAPHTHGNDIYCAWAATQMWRYSPETVLFNVLPMFHVAGAIVTSLAPLAAGGEIVILTAAGLRHPAALANHWRLVEKHRPTHIGGVPTNLAALLEVPSDGLDLSSVQCSLTGGASLPREIERRWQERFGQPPVQMYGMTEAGSSLTAMPIAGDVRLGSAGIRLPYGEWKIAALAADGSPGATLGAGEKGAVMFRSPSTFGGYLDPKHNTGTLTEDGWVITGDLGHIDEDGYLFLTGRSKDLIIRGAHNIDPAIIEEALCEHPAVALAAAVGRPDAYAGELPVAYVQLEAGASTTPEELLEFAEQRIAERPALPKEIVILDALPVTGVGKIFKPTLRWQQVEKVYRDALAPLADDAVGIGVAVGEDRQLGAVAKVKIQAADGARRDELEQEAGRLLDSFIFPFVVDSRD